MIGDAAEMTGDARILDVGIGRHFYRGVKVDWLSLSSRGDRARSMPPSSLTWNNMIALLPNALGISGGARVARRRPLRAC